MALAPYITPRISTWLQSYNTGLGNALFQIASVTGLAKTSGRPVSYHNVADYGNMLRSRYNYPHANTILRNFLTPSAENTAEFGLIHEAQDHEQRYDPSIITQISERSSSENIVIQNYLESVKYFQHCADEIIEKMQPDEESLRFLQSNMPILLDSTKNTVAVHYRCRELRYKYNEDYYKSAVAYIKEKVPDPIFVIFTDNVKEVRPETVGITEYIFSELPYDYLDIWAMNFCKHAITSNSTFAFWGTFLRWGDDKIVTYSNKYPADWYSSSSRGIGL